MRRCSICLCLIAATAAASEPAADPLAAPRAEFARSRIAAEREILARIEDGLRRAREIGDEPAERSHRVALTAYVAQGPEHPAVLDVFPAEIRKEYLLRFADTLNALQTAYEREIEIADRRVNLERALELSAEWKTIAGGERKPGLIDRDPGRIRDETFSWDHGGLLQEIDGAIIPEVLEIRHSGTRVQILGERSADLVDDGPDFVGHVGRLFLVPAVPQRGYLSATVPTRGDSTTYFVCLVSGGDVLSQIPLWLDVDRVYHWSLAAVEDEQRLELRIVNDAGKVLHRGRVPKSPDLSLGFGATVRRGGDRAGLAVVFADLAAPPQRGEAP